VLLEKIKIEKQKLIKQGKIKKEKPLLPITEDEKPFDIPDSWEWVRIGELCNYGKNVSIDAKYIPDSAWLLDLEDIEKDTGMVLHYKCKGDLKVTSSKHKFYEGNILYSKLRPYLNKVVVAKKDGYCTSEILALDFGTYIYAEYAQIMMMSPFFVEYAMSCSYGVKMPRLGTTDGCNALFSLPPFEEQQRIVFRIEELLALVDLIASGKKLKKSKINENKPISTEKVVKLPIKENKTKFDVASLAMVARADSGVTQDDVNDMLRQVQSFYDKKN
jgi:type I restriction enzyme S subunit